MNTHEAFAWLALLVCWLLVLIFGGVLYRVVRMPRWLRRLRDIERGREEQADA